jgi:hypothetical protein
MFDPGVLGTPAPQPPGWDNFGAAAVCFSETLLLLEFRDSRSEMVCGGDALLRATIDGDNLLLRLQ